MIVSPEEIDDLKSYRLARDIKNQIEDELQYPGHIKVTVVRETRAVEYAKFLSPSHKLVRELLSCILNLVRQHFIGDNYIKQSLFEIKTDLILNKLLL